ncbi:methyltransferase domain-containing protein [Conexibacter sp. W3-3-2]|uniref:class I SAM-dependent methyltransferase n=1 Tax=Conexibacter sp. W3-3-2 TaxID=2675227 RepID=UPI0012B9C132|nr:class I SAM-dependent methyltransferase [Conexibacter sp. W3-3-2]MTD44303.1 methyltransferase domain-containing protein [Conexibacter sp. W3-3-2]
MTEGSVPDTYSGNAYDKYGSRNPLVQRMLRGFWTAFDGLVVPAAPRTVLEVGCGEGVVTAHLAALPGVERAVGLDLDVPKLRPHWAARPDLEFVTGDATRLPFDDGSFDLVCLVEMLQLVPDADAALREALRVSRAGIVVTVPREPLWRILNVARGAHLRRLGNTPGHVHHFSRADASRLLAAHGRLVELRSAFPWTLGRVLAR